MTITHHFPTDSINILDLLITRPYSVSGLAKKLGWKYQDAEQKVERLAAAGLVQRSGNQDGLCQIFMPAGEIHRPDRMTEQQILLGIQKWRTIPMLSLHLNVPRNVTEQTLHWALRRGKLRCSCIGFLPVFRPNQPAPPSQ